MKWQNEMQTLGFNESNISQGLKTKIKDYNDIVKYIKELKETIKNPSVNDNVDELESTLVDMEEALETADDKLVKAIQSFEKNKERYAEIGKKMAEGRQNKKQQKQTTPAEPKVQTTPVVTPVASQPQVVETTEEPNVEKKATNWWLFAGAVVLAGVTFGLYKMRD